MQRVRIGLTGLSCVFLLVLLAAAFLGFVSNDPVADDTGAGNQTEAGAGNSAQDAPKDPLAELGVAPGNEPSGGNSQAR